MCFSCRAIQMQRIKSNDCIYNFLKVFPLKFNFPIKSFFLSYPPISCWFTFTVVIVLSRPCAWFCLPFSRRIF